MDETKFFLNVLKNALFDEAIYLLISFSFCYIIVFAYFLKKEDSKSYYEVIKSIFGTNLLPQSRSQFYGRIIFAIYVVVFFTFIILPTFNFLKNFIIENLFSIFRILLYGTIVYYIVKLYKES
jgi:hypothetical protein